MRTNIPLGPLLFLLLTCSAVLPAAAQLVFIPDTNMRAWLNSRVPGGVVDANGYMDTADPDIALVDYAPLLVSWSPSDLTGLEYLTSVHTVTMTAMEPQCTFPALPPALLELNIMGYSGSLLPALPASLVTMGIGGMPNLATLPSLPPGLINLTMGGMDVLTTLPALPNTLKYLWFETYMPQFTTLPVLPASLRELNLNGCPSLAGLPMFPDSLGSIKITGAPSVTVMPAWPVALTSLMLHGLSASALPPFPAGLRYLYLYEMPIQAVPVLPTEMIEVSLGYLPDLLGVPVLPERMSSVRLQELPSLPSFPALPDTLYVLDLALTQFDDLTNVPDSVVNLYISYMPLLDTLEGLPPTLYQLQLHELTGLNMIPDLPVGLWSLMIENCPSLECLPLLPDSMGSLYLSSSGLQCVSNLVMMEISPGTGVFYPYGNEPPDLPLCTVLNSTCPILNPVISGSVYHDANSNGVRDAGEVPIPSASITLQPLSLTFGVDAAGQFQRGVPMGSWTVTAGYNNLYVTGVSPGTHSASLLNMTDIDSLNDFGIALQPGVQDLTVMASALHPRPGFDNEVYLSYVNQGTIPMDGTLSFVHDPLQTWVTAYPPPTSQVGNTATWDVTGLQLGENGLVQVTLHTDAQVPIGTPVQHTATMDPVATDETPGDNVVVVTDTVTGSYDPNDKQVVPTILTPLQVQTGEKVIYTVRFQNTGTYLAERVVITDTLSDDLQASSFHFIGSSHPCAWSVQDGVVQFLFDGIMLPDSGSDQSGSNGFVRFSLEPVSSLLMGESVANTANIYFDFNEPVITNEAIFSVDASTSIVGEEGQGLLLAPNPALDQVIITGEDPGLPWMLHDAAGRVLREGRTQAVRTVIGLGELSAGVYQLRVQRENSWRTGRLVKR